MHISRWAFAAAILLSACTAHQAAAPRPPPAPTPLRNPSSIPLYPSATVIAVQPFHQVVTTQRTRGTVFVDGSGTYDGVEVLAASDASLGNLSAWLKQIGGHPEAQTQRYGFDYSAFERRSGGKTHSVLIVAMDPQEVDRQLGSVIGMIANYRSLPGFLRGPIDDQAKQRWGITISDAMQPTNPIGATLAALAEFEHRHSRGIVLIDAVRR